MPRQTGLAPLTALTSRRLLSLMLLTALALPQPGTAQETGKSKPAYAPGIFIRLPSEEHWKRLDNHRAEVKTKSGGWMQLPPDGMHLQWPLADCDGKQRGIILYAPPHDWESSAGSSRRRSLHTNGARRPSGIMIVGHARSSERCLASAVIRRA